MKIVRQMLSVGLVLCALSQACTARLYNPFLPNVAPPTARLEKSHPFGPPGASPRALLPILTNEIDPPFNPSEVDLVSPDHQDQSRFTLPQPSGTRVHFSNIHTQRVGQQLSPFLFNDIAPIHRLDDIPPFDLVHTEGVGRHFVPPQPIDVGLQFGPPQPADYHPPSNPFQRDGVGSHIVSSSHVPMPFIDFETTPIHHPSASAQSTIFGPFPDSTYDPSYKPRIERETPFFHPEYDLYAFDEGNGYNDFNIFDNSPSSTSPHFELGSFNPFEVSSPLASPFSPPAWENDHNNDLLTPILERSYDVAPWNREPALFPFFPMNPPVPHPAVMQPILDHMQSEPIHQFPPMQLQPQSMQPPHPMMNFVQPKVTPISHPIMNHPNHLPVPSFPPMANNPQQPPVHPLLHVMNHPHFQPMQPFQPAPIYSEPLDVAPYQLFHPMMNHYEPNVLVPF